jgi:hypothetical protein
MTLGWGGHHEDTYPKQTWGISPSIHATFLLSTYFILKLSLKKSNKLDAGGSHL